MNFNFELEKHFLEFKELVREEFHI